MAGLTKIESTGIANDVDFDGAGTLKLDSTNARVGVGITSPTHRLTVLRDNTAALKVGGNGSHVDGYHLELGQLGTNTSAGIKYTGSGGSMMFHNASGEVARFRPDGELCMGTTTATASRNLTLTGLTNDAGIQIIGTTSGGNCYITNTPGSSAATYIGNTNSQNLNFVVGGNVSSKMTIDSSGNVGINQTSINASRKVEITQPSSYTSALRVNSAGSSGNPALIEFFVGSSNYKIGGHHSTDQLKFMRNTAELVTIASAGELLLGTTTAPARGELLKVEKKPGGTQGAGIKLSGTYSLVDEGSQTFTIGNCALIFIAENNTGDGAMFFCTYKASAVSKVSDPHDRYANSDTDGKICVFKTAESHSVVLKNRCGATKSFTIGKINTSD